MNLTVVSTISLSSLSTNMRIPTAEFLAIFAATGQFSGPSESLCKVPGHTLDGLRLIRRIAGVEFSLLGQPPCHRGYTVKSGDICDTIAAANNAPTLVSSYITFAHFTHALKYSYQIICQNDNIDAKCTNLVPGEVKCVLRLLFTHAN